MDQQPQNNPEIEKATEAAEQGDKDTVERIINEIDPKDRAEFAEQMDELNAQRRGDDANLPDLEFTTTTGQDGIDRLADIVAKVPNHEKSFMKPSTWLSPSEIATDVYDPLVPGGGSGLLGHALEKIRWTHEQASGIIEEKK